jgi:hypothetical protein
MKQVLHGRLFAVLSAVLVAVLVVVLVVALKLVVAYAALDYLMPVAIRFAESGMGVRPPLDGFGGGLLYVAAVIAAFVGTSALAALVARRDRLLQACRATALLTSATAVVLFYVFFPSALLSDYNAAKIRAQMYVKYPPFRAAEDLRDTSMPFGALVLLADIALTLGIVLAAKRRPSAPSAAPLSTTDTSRAGS